MIKLFSILVLAATLCSFRIPLVVDYCEMTIDEREECIKDVWKHRQEIIELDEEGNPREFFEMFWQMLLMDKTLGDINERPV